MAGSDRARFIGLDISIVLRLIVGSPPDQAEAALALVNENVARGVEVVVSDLVVSEAYFALYAHYGVPKGEAIGALLEMLSSGLVEPAGGPEIPAVLEAAARPPAKPGFVYRLIHAQYRRVSANMATFERAARRLSGALVL